MVICDVKPMLHDNVWSGVQETISCDENNYQVQARIQEFILGGARIPQKFWKSCDVT